MDEKCSLLFEQQLVKKIILNHYKEYFKDKNITLKYKTFEEDEYSLACCYNSY